MVESSRQGLVSHTIYNNTAPEDLAINLDRLKHISMDFSDRLRNHDWIAPLIFFLSMAAIQSSVTYHAILFANADMVRTFFWGVVIAAAIWSVVAIVKCVRTDASVETFINCCINDNWRKATHPRKR